MRILRVVRLWSGRMYSVDDKFQREYRQRYRVLTDDPRMDGRIVSELADMPRLFSPYVTEFTIDLGSLCKKVTPTQSE